MLYPSNLEQKINFQKIKNLIKEECNSSLGRDYVEKISFSSDFSLVQKLLDQTDEFKKILESGESFPSSSISDISPFLEKAKLEGTFLDEDEFHELKLSLQTVKGCLNFFGKHGDFYPSLSQLLGLVIDLDMNLLKEIEKIIDEKGQIRSNASKELHSN